MKRIGIFLVVILFVNCVVALTWFFIHAPTPADAAIILPSAPSPSAASSPMVNDHHSVILTPSSHTRDLTVIDYQHFTVGFDAQRHSPAWVRYTLDGPILFPGPASKRPPRFHDDPRVPGEVHHDAYTKSGFDRGHLCPNYAMFSRFGADGAFETFVMSNVIPQRHGVNAGLWETLEEDIAGRDHHGDGWAGRRRHLTVINGPIYRGTQDYLPSGVPIPDAMFSVVLDYQEETGMYEALAWEIPNRDTVVGPLSRYLVSISAIEQETGLEIDNAIESLEVIPVSMWPTR